MAKKKANDKRAPKLFECVRCRQPKPTKGAKIDKTYGGKVCADCVATIKAKTPLPQAPGSLPFAEEQVKHGQGVPTTDKQLAAKPAKTLKELVADGTISISAVEWFDDRTYKVLLPPGIEEIYWSVTTVLGVSPKTWLARYRGDVGNREADLKMHEAMDRGSRIHHGCYAVANGGAVLYSPPWNKRQTFSGEQVDALRKAYGDKLVVLPLQDEAVQVWRYSRFLREVHAEVMASEQTVFSPKLKVAGTLDQLLFIPKGAYLISGDKPVEFEEDGNWVVDIKSGQEDDDHAVQTAVYVACAEEMGYLNIRGTLVVYTNAKTKKGIEGLKVEKRNRPDVAHDLDVFRHLDAIYRWKNGEPTSRAFEFPSLITLEEPAKTDEVKP